MKTKRNTTSGATGKPASTTRSGRNTGKPGNAARGYSQVGSDPTAGALHHPKGGQKNMKHGVYC